MTSPLRRPFDLFVAYVSLSRKVYREQGPAALGRAVRNKLLRALPRAAPPSSQATAPVERWAYEGIELLKPIEVLVVDRDYAPGAAVDFAVVVTVKNEAEGLPAFLASVAAQSLQPSEFILVDGGSTDDTVAIARAFADRHPSRVRVIEEGNLNIAAGRNLGARSARSAVLVFVDAGCRLRDHVFANLCGPFAADGADLVGGVYDVLQPCSATACFVPNWEQFPCELWQRFLPSARCMAVTRTLFEQAGGFPEHLTRTGEDTMFDVACRRYSRRWVLNKRARVVWDAPTTVAATWQLAKSYAVGDGESGVGDYFFKPQEQPSTDSLRGMQVAGYREGRARRPRIEVERRRIRSLVVLISGVPITDIGGGPRATQLALELTRAGCKVVFLNLYPRYGEQVENLFFDIDYTLLELSAHAAFDVDDFVARYGAFDLPCLVVTEFPHPEALPTVRRLCAGMRHASYVFDYIDLWDGSLGGTWYDPAVENQLIGLADHLVASAATLQQALAERSGREVHLVPNAVNSRLFRPDPGLPRPRDLPAGKPVVLYVGSLYGEWFDWAAVTAAVAASPELNFVFIGDHAAATPAEPLRQRYDTVFFLGPKAQRELPAYLQHAAVCVIPFRTDLALTRFVNPLKVYEYLAMRRPVVATDMAELAGIPGVDLAVDAADFAAKVKAGVAHALDQDRMAAFVAVNDWGARIRQLMRACGV